MVDRKLLGFILIILVFATVLSILIFSHEDEEIIRILASRTPDNIASSRPGEPSYSFEMMATGEIPDLVVKTYFLIRWRPPVTRAWTEVQGDEELFSNVPRLLEIMARLDGLGTQLGLGRLFVTKQIEHEGSGELNLLDFTDAVEAVAGADRIDEQYTAYAILLRDDGSASLYAGYRDFFFRRDTVITEVSLWTGNATKCYRSGRAKGGLGSCEPISLAPMGKIRLQDMVPNQRIRVDVSLDTSNMFGHSGVLQIVTTETGMGPGPSIVNYIGARGS